MQEITNSDDGTIKLDFDGYSAVIIPTINDKVTVCVSCQIGCPIGCKFCRSGKFVRNLNKEEILEQVKDCAEFIGKSPSSIVFMGTGEPMLNFDNCLSAIGQINKVYQVPFNKITVSTIGLNLDKLKNQKFNIAISLHSPFDDKRKEIIPNSTKIEEIVNFSKELQEKKNGLMIEYSLIQGINDREEDLNELIKKDWAKNTNFNLIEFNSFNGFIASDKLDYFKKKIIDAGYKCFIRQSRGKDISAACGMLSQNNDF